MPEARSHLGPMQWHPVPVQETQSGPVRPHASPVQDVHVGLRQRHAVWSQVSAVASGATRSDAAKNAAIANTADAVRVRRIAVLIIGDPIAEVGDVGTRECGISWGCLTPPRLHQKERYAVSRR